MSNILSQFKTFLGRIFLFFYWNYRNATEGLKIYNYRLPRRTILGKKTMIRRGTDMLNLSLDDYSYISGPGNLVEEAKIGKFCSIARQVTIGVKGHNYDWVTTSPIIVSSDFGFINKDILEPQKEIPIIGNDVWIGMNSIIMRGVTIGDGSVIAAGSVVTSDVLPYSIVGGVPAKHIRFRFSEDQIQKLLSIKWWEWEEEKIKDNSHLFYKIDDFIAKHYNN